MACRLACFLASCIASNASLAYPELNGPRPAASADPTVAVQNLINLYLTIEMSVPAASVLVPTIFFSNPADPIASFKASTAFAGGMPDAVLEQVTTAEMPHVITGRICSPSTVEPMTERIVLFLRDKLGKGLVSSPPRRVSRSPVRSPSITAAWPR